MNLPFYPRLPRTRGDCLNGPRPCPHDRCRHHLGLTRPETCSLDVADRGEHTQDQVAAIMGVSQKTVWNAEVLALRILKHDEVLRKRAEGQE